MSTVFLVLFLVVFSGNQLIKWTNKMMRGQKHSPANGLEENIDPQKIAVITAVVDQITLSKGKIDSIEHIK